MCFLPPRLSSVESHSQSLVVSGCVAIGDSTLQSDTIPKRKRKREFCWYLVMQSDLDARDARDSLFCKVSQLQDHVLRLLAGRIVLSLLGSGGEGEGARRARGRKMGRSAGGLGGGGALVSAARNEYVPSLCCKRYS